MQNKTIRSLIVGRRLPMVRYRRSVERDSRCKNQGSRRSMDPSPSSSLSRVTAKMSGRIRTENFTRAAHLFDRRNSRTEARTFHRPMERASVRGDGVRSSALWSADSKRGPRERLSAMSF